MRSLISGDLLWLDRTATDRPACARRGPDSMPPTTPNDTGLARLGSHQPLTTAARHRAASKKEQKAKVSSSLLALTACITGDHQIDAPAATSPSACGVRFLRTGSARVYEWSAGSLRLVLAANNRLGDRSLR